MTRLVSVVALAFALLLSAASAARADGEVILRGNYWRDRNTRVLAPAVTIVKPFAGGTTVDASYLLDAITSASASAGVMTNQPFTELRSEVDFGVSQRVGPATIGGRYRYSTESDYWAHTGGLTLGLDLFQKNLTLGAAYFYTHGEAAQRAAATGYLWGALSRKHDDSVLSSHFGMLSASQVLSRHALLEGSYELSFLDGYQANPYRTVKNGGSPVREVVPDQRVRHVLTAGLRLTPLYRRGALHDLGLYLKYRLYTDSWGILAHTPELRVYGTLGPVTMRLTGRYHTQSQAGFYRSSVGTVAPDGQPVKADIAGYDTGVPFDHCNNSQAGNLCYTGDSKLGAFQSVFVEGRLELSLRFLDRPLVPVAHFIGGSRIGVSLGYYYNQIAGHYTQASPLETVLPYAYVQYGNAWVGGLDIVMPL